MTMLHQRMTSFVFAAFAVVSAAVVLSAGGSDVRIVNAAMNGDRDAVRRLIKEAADVNSAQGDGITALHAAALKGDAEIVQMLLYAGANIRATTRIGAYTPVFMA